MINTEELFLEWNRLNTTDMSDDEVLRLADSFALIAELNSARQTIAEQGERIKELEQRNDLFTDCIHRAYKLWHKAHPESEMMPDGAENIAWLIEEVNSLNNERFEWAMDADRLSNLIYKAEDFNTDLWKMFAEEAQSIHRQLHERYPVTVTQKG